MVLIKLEGGKMYGVELGKGSVKMIAIKFNLDYGK